MWWLWCTLGLADVSDDLQLIKDAGRAIAAAQGCALAPLRVPPSLRSPQQQAAAVVLVRQQLARWQAGCAEGTEPAAPVTVEEADAVVVAWLRVQGQPEAAARWAALADRSRVEASGSAGCSCMGKPVRGTPIVYGYPGRRLIRQSQRGRVVLGGCVVSEDAPDTDCPLGCQPQ